jgi:hypothetical protein
VEEDEYGYRVDNYSGMESHVLIYYARPASDGSQWYFDYDFASAEKCETDGRYDYFDYHTYLGSMDELYTTEDGLTIYRGQFGVHNGAYVFSNGAENSWGQITLTPDFKDPRADMVSYTQELSDSTISIFVMEASDVDEYLDSFVAYIAGNVDDSVMEETTGTMSEEEIRGQLEEAAENAPADNSDAILAWLNGETDGIPDDVEVDEIVDAVEGQLSGGSVDTEGTEDAAGTKDTESVEEADKTAGFDPSVLIVPAVCIVSACGALAAVILFIRKKRYGDD